MADPLRDREGLLFADIDESRAMEGKFDLDVAGHYSRPDIFRLMVDQREKAAVAKLEE